MTLHLLADLTRDRAAELAATALLVVPIGSTEQHGPHLPAGTDSLHAEVIARGAAERCSTDIVVAPTLPYGSSHHHLEFGATLSLDTKVLYDVLMSIGRSAAGSGFERIFILNGHGGNHEIAELAARDLALQESVDVAAGSWWQIAHDALVDAGADGFERFPGHAGGFETAIMMALRPHLVDAAKLPVRGDGDDRVGQVVGFRSEFRDGWGEMDGWTDDPAAGDSHVGQRLVDAASQSVADAFESFAASAS